MKKHIFILFFISILSAECEPGYIEINELCFYENDINILQKMIDNSYQKQGDIEIEKLFFKEISFTRDVFPAPDGDDSITIIPS